MQIKTRKLFGYNQPLRVHAWTPDKINIKRRGLAPDRSADLLKSLMKRRAADSEAADRRLHGGHPERLHPFDHRWRTMIR